MSSEMRRVVWRLEFPQPPGWRIQWLGPYTSQWLTAEAEEIVRFMETEHCATHPHPSDPSIFLAYPGDDRLACGCATRVLLEQWFGAYLPRLLEQGAYITQYSVPTHVVVEDSPEQVLFVHRRAAVIERWGHEAPAPLIRSSAGSRAAIMAASDGKYDFTARSGDRSADRASSMNRAG
jgi:hypothetical protein